ncbi:hypothetical protein RJ641_008227 [Dillenia turbinata]|uniref:Uncharacterized protein n=1 Tax=Dillenia turbinata TaxID=194707 RepID=A0AAN8ZAK5_9MAGN
MEENWSERVEDFVEEGNIDAAISFLESVVSKLETLNSSSQLSSALSDLSKLCYLVGLSDKADHIQSRALLLKNRNVELSQQQRPDSSSSSAKLRFPEKERVPLDDCSPSNDSYADRASDDDWEAIADLEPDKLLSPQGLPELSKLSVEDDEVQSLNMKR